MTFDSRLQDFQRRMSQTIDVLLKEFSGLRTGRASMNLLDPLKVDSYGALMPLNQVATVGAPEPRLLTVQVWDRSLVKNVEKAIRDANLGLNPIVEGQLIRVPIPPLNEERRLELTKVAAKYGEEARIAVRNVRRDAMDMIKKMEKDGKISEDEQKRLGTEIQKMTDDFIGKIDAALATRQKDIMHV